MVKGIHIRTMEPSRSFNVGVTANLGYKFNINENNGISILTEIGYSRLDLASSFIAYTDSRQYSYKAKQNLVFHTLNIGLMPKYTINVSPFIKNLNPNYDSKMEIAVGIGFGIKMALAGEYYNTMNNNADENYKSHLAEKYSFKDIKRKFDYPIIPYIKFQMEDYFYINEKAAFLIGASMTYNFDIFYDILNISYEIYKKRKEEGPAFIGDTFNYYEINKYGFSSFEFALHLGMKFGN